MNKVVINHLEKLFVTNDAATIIKELDVFHPAAKLVVMAAQRQEEEIGDATNLVVVLAGEFLNCAESLLRTGLHQNDIITGFDKSVRKAGEILESLVAHKVEDLRDEAEVAKALRTAISSKQYGYEDLLAPIIAKACISVMTKKNHINIDDVRVAKLVGGGISDIHVIKGVIVDRSPEGTVKHVSGAKVAVYTTGIDYAKTDAKETFLVTSPDQLEKFAPAQEATMEKAIKEIADSGVNVVVSGGKIGEMAMHFIEKYKLLAVKTSSKFEIRRICRATGATPLVRLGAPTAEEMGFCDEVNLHEIGSAKVTLFKQEKGTSKIATIVTRGATQNILDDLERGINDGVNTFKALTTDGRFVAGAGATEIEIARQLKSFGESTPGQDQYAIRKFGEALEVVPRTLAENAGHDATAVISKIYAAHAEGKAHHGINVETGEIEDARSLGVFDTLASKKRALELATDAAITVLRIDQIIMAKPAGGPAVRAPGPQDAD
jgi:T-complex protein 1 subunit theta